MLSKIPDLSECVVPITGDNPAAFGTGFVIYKNDSKTFLLTCRHVIDSIENEEELQADYQPARVIASDQASYGFDLAVLCVDTINNKKKLQTLVNDLFHLDNDGGTVIIDSGSYPILWALATLDKKLNIRDENYPQYIYNDSDFEKFAELFLSQLNVKSDKKELIKNISDMSFLLSENNRETGLLSDSLNELSHNHDYRDYYNFCDLFLFHQVLELLFRQVATPYHVNVERTKRWTYKAKDTRMFMDMIVLDECRYLYDWMPTSDMLSFNLSDIQRQLVWRFVLDGVSKHRRWYSSEYFSGTAVVDQHTKNFEAKILEPRIAIK